MSDIHLYAPSPTAITRGIWLCRECKRRTRHVAKNFEYQDSIFTCCQCGRAETGGYNVSRRKGDRARTIEWAKREWLNIGRTGASIVNQGVVQKGQQQ